MAKRNDNFLKIFGGNFIGSKSYYPVGIASNFKYLYLHSIVIYQKLLKNGNKFAKLFNKSENYPIAAIHSFTVPAMFNNRVWMI